MTSVNYKKISKQTVIFIALLVSFCTAQAQKIEDFSVITLSPIDERVVIKDHKGKMKILKAGDKLPGVEATLIKVSEEKIVLREVVKKGEIKAKEEVWVYKAVEGKSRVKRISLTPSEKELEERKNRVVEKVVEPIKQ